MRTRGRLVLGSAMVLVGASAALAACVGDDPTQNASSTDASTSSDGSTTDTAVADTGLANPPDASDAGPGETFDGANPTCNGLFPQDAPAVATIECDGGLLSGATLGGNIQTGRYYLVDQKYPFALCPADPATAGYSDVIVVTDTGDAGFTVNAALNHSSPFNTRLTLAWAVTGDDFNQYDICPNDGSGQNAVPFSAPGDGTLTYELPTFGDLTFKKF